MNDSLRYAKIARCDALVEASQAILMINLLDAVAYTCLARLIVIELESRLDEPNRVGGGR